MSATRTSGHLDSDGAFRAGDDEHAAVGDETVDAAGGLDRDVTATGALRGDLRDVREGSGPDGDQQPVLPDLGHGALDGFLVGANRPGAELDDRAAPSCPASRSTTGPAVCAVRPAVAEDHRLFPDESFDAGVDRTVQHRRSDADVDVGQSGVTVGAQGRQERRGVGNGDHVGRPSRRRRADKVGALPPARIRRRRMRRDSGGRRPRRSWSPRGRGRWRPARAGRQPMPR